MEGSPIFLMSDELLTIGQRLLELSEQVADMAEQLRQLVRQAQDSIAKSEPHGLSQSEVEHSAFFGQAEGKVAGQHQAARLPLPDPRLIRRIIGQRQLRARHLAGDLFADPAWDMLLDLTAARAEHTRVSVSSLCIASGVPPTTALRWISLMVNSGLFQRIEDDTDRRRAFIALTDNAANGMARYFAELGQEATRLV